MTYVIYAHLKMLAQVPIFTQMAATNVQIADQREKSKEVRLFWMRMIDADSAKQELLWGNVYLSDNETNALVELLDNQPAIDPESLRSRGTWEGAADGYADGELVYDTWTCSECGYTVETDDPDALFKFCPNCGAKMEVNGHAKVE